MSETTRRTYTNPIDWAFRSRADGRFVLVQLPNLPLLVFLVAAAVRLVFHPAGQVGVLIGLVATLALVIWAALEVLRGVNPFRRIVGAVVLLSQAVGFLLTR